LKPTVPRRPAEEDQGSDHTGQTACASAFPGCHGGDRDEHRIKPIGSTITNSELKDSKANSNMVQSPAEPRDRQRAP